MWLRKTTLFGLTRSVLFIITVINISIGADNKAETTYLRFRSDFKKCWGGCSNWIWRKENANSLVRGDPTLLPPSQMAFSVFSGAVKPWPVRTEGQRQLLHALRCARSGSRALCWDQLTLVHSCCRTWRCHGCDGEGGQQACGLCV